ncbi:MAG: hypothetical protein ACXABY_26145, partial [Candidatus Thorarchaeota archaeon]
TATGWYGTKRDYGAIEFPGDAEPTLTDEALEQDPSATITLNISARNATTGVADSHDWSDFVVCSNGATLSNCLATVVWSKYGETATPLTADIPADTLAENTDYWWVARTHNAWPYDGAWETTPDQFSTSGGSSPEGDLVALVDGNSLTMQYCVFDCLGEAATGIKVTGTSAKIYNALVLNCGTYGLDANQSMEAKNTGFRNNAGGDIDILTAMTVTADSNSIQDAAKSGDGTYSSVTSDFSKPNPYVQSNYKVSTGSHYIDGGGDLYGVGQVDLFGTVITDEAGDPALGEAIDIGVHEAFPQQTSPLPFPKPVPIPKPIPHP